MPHPSLRIAASLGTIILTLGTVACVSNSASPDLDAGEPGFDGGSDDATLQVDAAETSAADSTTDTFTAPVDAADATASDSSSRDVAAEDAADAAPSDAGLDAADAAATQVHIDAVNGSDVAPGDGTAAHPYQSVSKAASVAVNGQTIYASAGTYPLGVATVHLANGVGVAATTYGTATFAPTSGTSEGLTFDGSGFVHGITMRAAWINVGAGTVALDGVQVQSIGDQGATSQSGVNVTGTGHVVVTPGGLTSYISAADVDAGVGAVSCYASVIGTGQLEIHGGAFLNGGPNEFSDSALIEGGGTAQITLDGVTFDGAKTSAVASGGSPTVTFENGTTIHACGGTSGSVYSVNINNGSPTYVFDDTTVSAAPNAAVYVNGGANPSITFRNGTAITGSGAQGILFGGSGAAVSTLTFDTATITNNGGNGVDLENGIYTVTMRSTQITGNTGYGIGGTLVAGSVLDLGTATTAGSNTLSGNAVASTGKSNLDFVSSLTTASVTINAVGNTWDPSVQTSDTSGHFPAGTSFSAPPAVTGKNVMLTQGSTSAYVLKLVAAP